MQAVSAEYIKSLPKAELHLHLEGAITPAAFLELSRKYQTGYQALSERAVAQHLFNYKNFNHFLQTYKIVCQHLREPTDYVAILNCLTQDLVVQNVCYAEVTFTPSIPWKFERNAEEILAILLKRSREIESSQNIVIRWIVDCVRQFGREAAERSAELANQFREDGVVGLGLGGDEDSLAMGEYAEVFSWARAHQLYLHVHAGEIGNADQIWQAMQLLGANRIGHGIQAVRDSRLIDYLRDHAVPLDVCLTSNQKTRAWVSISENPFGRLYKRGVLVTLNTDDPGLFQISLVEEYLKAVQFFGLSRDDIQRLVLQGVGGSFLPYAEKMNLMQQFQDKIRRISTLF